MGERNDTQRPQAACTAEERDLVRDLVAFAKASFVYPFTNNRVVETGNAFLGALAGYTKVRESFELQHRAGQLFTPSGCVDSASPLQDWFRECLQKVRLGSLRFRAGVAMPALHDWLHQLRTNNMRAGKYSTFESLWPTTFPGIELAELRFFGGYHELEVPTQTAEGTVRAALDAPDELQVHVKTLGLSDGVLARVVEMSKRIAATSHQEANGVELNLLRELMAALPADVAADPVANNSFVAQVVDEFEHLLHRGDSDTERLLHRFREVARAFFRSTRTGPDNRPEPMPAPRRRDLAESEAQDAEQVQQQVLALPELPIAIEPDPGVLEAEVLSVCLRRLGNTANEHEAEPVCERVQQLLAGARPPALAVLDRYVLQVLQPEEGVLPARAVQKVMSYLGERGLMPEVRRRCSLTPKQVAQHYPHGFLYFLDSLDETRPADQVALSELLTQLEEEALAENTHELMHSEGLLLEHRLRKLFGPSGRELLPLARHMLRHETPAVREATVKLLLRLNSRRPETLPLLFIEPSSRIPGWYIEGLCELEHSNHPNPRLNDYAGLLLRNHVESLPNDARVIDRKVQAILALGMFPGPSTEQVLHDVLHGEGWWASLWVPRQIRRAVRAVQNRWHEVRRV